MRRKLVIVGDGSCGKTSLLIVAATQQFPNLYVPTVFDSYILNKQIDNIQLELEMLDTAGQIQYDSLRSLSYSKTDIVLLCFSIDCPISLENVDYKWKPELNCYCPHAPILLVGTKKDLRTNEEIIKELGKIKLKPIMFEEGLRTASRIGALKYFETSAIANEGVGDLFDFAARIAISKKESKKCIIL